MAQNTDFHGTALELLKGGPEGKAEWNRRQLFRTGPEHLSGIDLSGADLSNVSFIAVRLSNANLRGASLVYANLRGTDLIRTDLAGADLMGANLTATNFSGANLTAANLSGAAGTGAIFDVANLTGASLFGTIFDRSHLVEANLTDASCGQTTFGLVDLSETLGLDTVKHVGPSTIGLNTILMSKGRIPDGFLRGCGVPDEWITYIPDMLGSLKPIQFYSCFISYSTKDSAFAERLHADLQAKGVRCWFAPEDLKIGAKLRIALDESIRVHDKLLLILSKHSIASEWVEKEVETAMERERQENRTVLFPIRLDDAVMDITTGWPADIKRTRHIGDFKRWKKHDAYTKAFDRLLRDLNQTEPAK